MVAQIDVDYLKARPARLWSWLLSDGLFEGRPFTTRGQFVNPLLFRRFALQKRPPQMRKVKALIFILSTGRSGTTIIGIVLSRHRDVGYLNEPEAIWSTLRDDEDLIGSYHRGPARYRVAEEDASLSLINDAHRGYGAYLRLTLTQRVVNKHPALTFHVPFVRQIFPDAKFLFLSRDGRDTCASIEHWSARRGSNVGAETHDWWGVNRRKCMLLEDQIIPEDPHPAPHAESLSELTDNRAMAGTEWIVTMREGLRLVDSHRKDVVHGSHADLCAHPEEACARISEFAQLPPVPVSLDYAKSTLSPLKPKTDFPLPKELEALFGSTSAALAGSRRS
ncbi:MAG: sulfotransferase [Accumulibacter sp.]|jgi:hypothetical protein|uniref:sulfotransferase family protein n=1 Tax=Accumulibacter sp. TaxID=2053492 RepID=UPI002FC3236C